VLLTFFLLLEGTFFFLDFFDFFASLLSFLDVLALFYTLAVTVFASFLAYFFFTKVLDAPSVVVAASVVPSAAGSPSVASSAVVVVSAGAGAAFSALGVPVISFIVPFATVTEFGALCPSGFTNAYKRPAKAIKTNTVQSQAQQTKLPPERIFMEELLRPNVSIRTYTGVAPF
jgi:hypothetical protein